MHQVELYFATEEKIDVSKFQKITAGTVRAIVHQWLLDHVGQEVIGKDIQECDPLHSLSGDRIMRYLRLEGWCRIPCICRPRSRFFVEYVVKFDGTIIRSVFTAKEYVKGKIDMGEKYKLEG